jgi:integrase
MTKSVTDKHVSPCKLLALTFVRTNELIGALWSEFDLDNTIWIIPAERMKMRTEHVVPLASQALELLSELKEISANSRFVFPGRNPSKTISNNTMLFRRLQQTHHKQLLR